MNAFIVILVTLGGNNVIYSTQNCCPTYRSYPVQVIETVVEPVVKAPKPVEPVVKAPKPVEPVVKAPKPVEPVVKAPKPVEPTDIVLVSDQEVIVENAKQSNWLDDLEIPYEVKVELEERKTSLVPMDLKNKDWYRWTTDNFTILSMDKKRGEYLVSNIENIKQAMLSKWGFPNIAFPLECRVLCFKDKELFYKAVRLHASQVEFKKSNPDFVVIFLLLDKSPQATLPIPITEAALVEYGVQYNLKIPLWAYRGMSLLNQPVIDVREQLTNSNKQAKYYSIKNLLNFTSVEWYEQTKEDRKSFDVESMILCLMLRKEFGEVKLHSFLNVASKENPEKALKIVYGFNSYEHFEKSYQRYTSDLVSDLLGLRSNELKTPDSYLTINSVK